MRAKPVSQQRSQEKRDRILKAMKALLRRERFSEISIAELAAKAEVSPATIYQRFSNIDATASVLLELYYASVEDWTRQRPRKLNITADTPLYDALVEIAADAYDQTRELGHVMRPAYLYSRQRPDRVGPEWERLQAAARQGFKSFLQSRQSELQVTSIEDAASFLAYFFNIMMLGPLLHAQESGWKGMKDSKQFSHAIATMAYRYLTVKD